MRWVLPDSIQDDLPSSAEQLEHLRRRLLDVFRGHGYQLVRPPLLEYLDSLTIGSGRDLELRTFKLVDQISGRTLGIRADTTPQVARIDAQLLNRRGVARLCYCGSVLHTLPSTLTATREPLQLGAELYGHAGIEADIEIVRLLATVLHSAEMPTNRIDLCHIGLFRALAEKAGLVPEQEQALFELLLGKDIAGLRAFVADIDEPVRSALLALPELYGGAEVLDQAASLLPDYPEIRKALGCLRVLIERCADLPLSLDLADLRGYHYHTGVMFAAYIAGAPAAVASGGRYDQVGRAFGRGRPATGFSVDLRELASRLPAVAVAGAILAPADGDEALSQRVSRLRDQGEIVMTALPGHEGSWREAGCDRQLIRRDDGWTVVALQGE